MTALIDLVLRGERQILEAFLSRAETNGYFRFASHDTEGWRSTVRGFSDSLVRSLRRSPEPAALAAEDLGRDDGLSAFGVAEARRRRLEGMPLGIFLGILKLLRQSYLERLGSGGLPREEEDRCRLCLERFFDRNEVASCVAWTTESGFERVEELARKNDEAAAELLRNHGERVRQEKMASIDRLTTGVTREIGTPIGYIHSNLVTLGKYLSRLTAFLAAQSECIAAGAPAPMADALRRKRAQLKLDYILPDVEDLIRESVEGVDRIRGVLADLKGSPPPAVGGGRKEDINGCIRRSLLLSGNEARERATLRMELGEIPPTRCDPRQIERVFRNLVANAADAIEGHGIVTVRSWAEDGFICVSVESTGHGIPEGNLDRIPEPSFTALEDGGRTGSGLGIASGIVKEHGGSIMARSRHGKGTTFTLRLPVIREA